MRGKNLVSLRTASEARGEAADPIVSPFDPSVDADVNEKKMDEGPMELTLENVEKVFLVRKRRSECHQCF